MIIIIQRFSHLNKQFLVQSLNVSIGKLSCYFVLSEKNRKWERDLGQIFNNMDFSPFHIVRKLVVASGTKTVRPLSEIQSPLKHLEAELSENPFSEEFPRK